MNLRRQLILVSLLTLSLPWAGCQYIQEMEKAMRQGQVIALAATATAVANRIASDNALQQPLLHERWQQPQAQQLYVHRLTGPMFVDGYDDEWRYLPITPQVFQNTDDSVHWRLSLGQDEQRMLLFAQVTDANIFYHNPSLDDLASGDHFRLRTLNRTGQTRDYIIRSGAPGEVTAYYQDGRRIRQEPRIRGFWQENADGFQLELSWPKTLLGDHLGVALVNVDEQPEPTQIDDERRRRPLQKQWLGNLAEHSTPPFWAAADPVLTEAVSVFASNGVRLRVVSNNHWLLADAGQLQQPRGEEYETHGLMQWFYRLLLGRQYFPELASPQLTGHFSESEILSAQVNGQSVSGWYQWGVRRVGRAVVPIQQGLQSSMVVAEQSSDTLMALTNTAFNRLVFYTLLATAITGIGLLAYASWLSLRIRRLSDAAASAVDDSGQIRDDFPQSKAADEIGELTRHYGELLARLREYTEYLRTLSSKLSHELRTPLAVVRSSLDNLEHEGLPDSARTYAQRAQDGGKRLSSILNAMSSASRVEASIESADKETFVLGELLQQVGVAYNDMFQHCGVSVFVDERVAATSVLMAPDLIVQMLDKLVDNAGDFCPQDGAIQIALLPTAQGVELSVSNDGPLLPDHMKYQLFDSLVSLREQADNNNVTHLGLGLHIVRLIVEFHGGSVQASNRDDLTGVVFSAQFPLSTA